jgi:hypothetical protein
MKKRSRSIQVLLVISISLFVLALPAYLHCRNLSEIKFASYELSFETPDQENELAGNENELKIFGPSAFSTTFLPDTNFFEQYSHLFPQVISLRQNTLVLRC